MLSGRLQGLEHDIGGSISISSNCTLKASSFSYDGQAPQVFWWGAPSCNAADIKKEGFRISNEQLQSAATNSELSVKLFPDVEWPTVGCIIIYCEEFYADLGHVEIVKQTAAAVDEQPPTSNSEPNLEPVPSPTPPSPASNPPSPKQEEQVPPPQNSPSPTSSTPKYSAVEDLPNCMELIPGYFNLHWAVTATAASGAELLTLGLEGRPGTDNRWLGFGFSPSGSTGPTMVGSDVVIAGIVNGKGFAYNYQLSSRDQCDFSTGDGVCPTFAGKSPLNPKASAVDLLAYETDGDVMKFLLTRPLGASEDGNVAWPANGSRFSVFAMGPVSEASNSSIPVVLYHSLQLPGMSSATSVHAANYQTVKINLQGPSTESNNNCRKIVPGSNTAQGPVSAPAKPVATIDGPTTFEITTGSNENYPNPPAWGYSLWVNGNESPVVVVRRGTFYTFTAAAGPTHPIYITTSIVGGGSLVDYSGEEVFAGNETTYGTPEAPVTFSWTPNENTPDTVYYQCTVHQKLGWEIMVLDEGAPPVAGSVSAASAPAPAPSSGSSSKSGCVIDVDGVSTLYAACLPVPNILPEFILGWNLLDATEVAPTNSSGNTFKAADSSSGGGNVLSMALRAKTNPSQPAFIAVGFPKNPGSMIGASAMVIQALQANGNSGAQISEFLLSAKAPSGVKPSTDLGSQMLSASLSSDGVLSGSFQIMLAAKDAQNPEGSRRRLFGHQRTLLQAATLDFPLSEFPLLFAAGRLPANANGAQLQVHDAKGSATVDLSAALATGSDSEDGFSGTAPSIVVTTGSINTAARTAHMWLMTLSFGVIIPLGVIIARWMPPPQNNKGFQAHRAVQTIGFLTACGGFAAAFVAVGTWNSAYNAHRDIGIAIVALGLAQFSALLLRPSLESSFRKPWALGHRWLGRITALLAICQIYYGIIHVAKLEEYWWGIFTAVLGILLILYAFAVFKGNRYSGHMQAQDTEKADETGRGSPGLDAKMLPDTSQ